MSLKSRRVKTAILAVFVALAFVLPLVPPGGAVVSASAMDHCGLVIVHYGGWARLYGKVSDNVQNVIKAF